MSFLSFFLISSCQINIETIIIENSKNIIVLFADANIVGENPIINLDASPTKNTNTAILFFKFLNISIIDNMTHIKFINAKITGSV